MESGLTIPSGSWHGQVEGGLTDKSSGNCFYSYGGVEWGSIPVFIWEPTVLVIFQWGLETPFSLWIPAWASVGVKLTTFLHIFSQQVILDGGPIPSRGGGSQIH